LILAIVHFKRRTVIFTYSNVLTVLLYYCITILLYYCSCSALCKEASFLTKTFCNIPNFSFFRLVAFGCYVLLLHYKAQLKTRNKSTCKEALNNPNQIAGWPFLLIFIPTFLHLPYPTEGGRAGKAEQKKARFT
jgi:hypothetical protein